MKYEYVLCFYRYPTDTSAAGLQPYSSSYSSSDNDGGITLQVRKCVVSYRYSYTHHQVQDRQCCIVDVAIFAVIGDGTSAPSPC